MQNQFSGFSVANVVSSIILLALLGAIALLIVRSDINPKLEPFTAGSTTSQVYLPVIVGKPPLKAVASRSEVKVGVTLDPLKLDELDQGWEPYLNLIER